MSASITARIPTIDWNKSINKHWNNSNPVASHVFNALSFMFPQGEQFFIDSAKEVSSLTDLSEEPELKEEIRLFISQEAIHGAQHTQCNMALEKNGYRNVVYGLMDREQRFAHKYFSPITKLAFVCGYEHFTAMLGDYLLSKPSVIANAEPDFKLIWEWHAVEEIEHKSVCFDLYKHAGGGWFKRAFVYLFVTLDFFILFSTLFWSMLYKDGLLTQNAVPNDKAVFIFLLWKGRRYLAFCEV